MNGADARRLEPALAEPAGGLLIPVHGYVRVGRLATALADAARARGAVVLEGHKVERIERSGPGCRSASLEGCIPPPLWWLPLVAGRA